MKNPKPISIETMDGKVVRAKCAACDEELPLDGAVGTEEDQKGKLAAAFGKHLRIKHPEDFSQAAARIVREATEKD